MEDSLIVDLYFERNEQAIAETQNKYGRLCTKIAAGILKRYEDAEEQQLHKTVERHTSEAPGVAVRLSVQDSQKYGAEYLRQHEAAFLRGALR